MIKLNLYSISDNKDCLYVVSYTSDEKFIRNFHTYNYHEGMNNDDFYRIAKTGTFKQINSLSEVPEEDREIIPYDTNEKLPNGKYLYFDATITDFFNGDYI